MLIKGTERGKKEREQKDFFAFLLVRIEKKEKKRSYPDLNWGSWIQSPMS